MGCLKLTYRENLTPLKVVHGVFETSGKAGAGVYRYGFQGQETDKEWLDGAVSFKYRIHDPRLGRFLSIDPLSDKYPYNSPYAFQENKLGLGIELEGLELFSREGVIYNNDHTLSGTINKDGKLDPHVNPEPKPKLKTSTSSEIKAKTTEVINIVEKKYNNAKKSTSEFMKENRPLINEISKTSDDVGNKTLVISAGLGIVSAATLNVPGEAIALTGVGAGFFLKGVSGAIDITANAVEAWANDDPNKATQAAVGIIVNVTTGKLLPKGNTDMLIDGMGQAVNEMVGEVSENTVDEFVPPLK
jgi:RHS repeat-associated protein